MAKPQRISKYTRIKGGEKNEKTGIDWTRPELEKVYELYIEIGGIGIHERNPKIHDLAKRLDRTPRSVENQLLGFRKIDKGETGRQNYNRLISVIWKAKTEQKTAISEEDGFHFRISSALKDIIGRDLITDEYIAVFELVKNSYDAYATRVDIHFENIYSNDAKIIIKDNGKGMDNDDLKNKWLFVAYSAKKEGTEDDSFDYRDNIYKKRAFAGAKGIGRFSCDRLGAKLHLETTKKSNLGRTEVLLTDWGQFEESAVTEFVDISVKHYTKETNDYGLSHGTALCITELRNEWDRNKLLRLKNSLAKLINPNKDKGEQSFNIYINVPEEAENDSKQQDERQQINGKIKNFIFETLGLKTTKIEASISQDGETISTVLSDGGSRIYRIVEKNKYNLLDSVDCTLYYLNQAAKLTFIHRMGVSSKEYGHVFLYKNGFRIYPYGEWGDDPLKIDARKNQGIRRFLGTRELIGQIEIYSDTDQLKETSSRGDGLIRTQTYEQLELFFWDVLKRLEKYVVDVQKWGLSIETDDGSGMRESVISLLSKLTSSDSIIEFEYPENFYEIIESHQSQSAIKVLENLNRIALNSEDNELLEEVTRANRVLHDIREAKYEVEKERDNIETEKIRVEEKLKIKEVEVELLKETSNEDIVELMSIEHHVNQATFRVIEYLQDLITIAKEDSKYKEQIIECVDKIALENQKIASLVKFVSKANFDLLSASVTQNIVQYISEYIKNVYKRDKIKIINKTLVKNVNITTSGVEFITTFIPLELNIVIDNLLDNSFKASATDVEINLTVVNGNLRIDYSDNGIGINEIIKDEIFNFGVTTTSGSGIGLYHSRKIIESLGGKIYLKDSKNGANFILEIPQNTTL